MIVGQPLISVVMAVYDPPLAYLKASVESILGQTLRDFEFIIVDDGSGAPTKACLQHFVQQDERVRLVTLVTNGGLTKALNQGLARAAGEFVARQDADDLSAPTRFAMQAQYLVAHPEVAAVCSNAELIDENGVRQGLTDIDPGLALLSQRNVLIHGAMLFRREALERVGRYDERMRLAQDYELYLRMLGQYALRLAVLAQPLYQLRQHSLSLSSKKRLRQLYYAVLAKRISQRRASTSLAHRVGFAWALTKDLVVTHRLLLPAILSARRRRPASRGRS